MVRLETQVVRRCKALQAAAWQRHAKFEVTQQVSTNCVFQVYPKAFLARVRGERLESWQAEK